MKSPKTAPAARKLPRRMPWELPANFPSSDWTPEIVALQALAQGTADEFQQRTAWRFIVEVLSNTDAMSFQPPDPKQGFGGIDAQRASDFAEGVRWVGRQMRVIARLKRSGVDTRGEPPAMPAQQPDRGP